MKNKHIYITLLVIGIGILTTFFYFNKKTYSYGILKQVSESNGAKIINYIDSDTNATISFDDARNYFGIPVYDELYYNGTTIYFERGKEISKNQYLQGVEKERADESAALYGTSAYRVSNTNQFVKAFDDIYQNLKIGEFHIFFSKYEPIDFNYVSNYYKAHYGVNAFNQNYYTYQVKGPREPDRYGIDFESAKNNGEIVLTTAPHIRISGNETVIVEDFANKLLPYLHINGSDYEKILATYTYIKSTTQYLTDNGFINDALASNTSTYDALIMRKTTCIGYSIAFSYLMDKMGIESYIVDQIVEASGGNFYSAHTYNVVKLDNKFYKLDLTGGIFLGGVNQGDLYNNNLNVSRTAYRGNTDISIDFNSINSILNNSKNIKTTTTRKVIATTTTKNYNYSLPTTGNKKTTNETNTSNPTENFQTQPVRTTIITKKSENGEIITIPVEVNEAGEIITKESGEYKEVTTNNSTNPEEQTSEIGEIVTKPNENKAKKKSLLSKIPKINYNYILIPLFIIIVAFAIIYKIKDKKKVSVNSKKAQEILNRDIIKKDDDEPQN